MAESWDDARLAHRHRQAASIATSALSLMTEHGASALTMAAIAERDQQASLFGDDYLGQTAGVTGDDRHLAGEGFGGRQSETFGV